MNYIFRILIRRILIKQEKCLKRNSVIMLGVLIMWLGSTNWKIMQMPTKHAGLLITICKNYTTEEGGFIQPENRK